MTRLNLLPVVTALLLYVALATSAPQDPSARYRRSNPPPKRFSTNPNPGENMDKSLGMKKKNQAKSTQSKYPWDPTSAKVITLHYTEAMKQFIKPEEEQFRDDYYDDYDFEFPKGMIRNDNFETKKRMDMERRLKEGS